jgi:hypothetical protein
MAALFQWDAFVEVVIAYAIAALVIERSLYQIFDSKLWRRIQKGLNDAAGGEHADLKPWISVAVCITVAWKLELDMLAFMFSGEPRPLTIVLTGLFLAGGSTGVYKFLKRARLLKEAKNEAAIAGITSAPEAPAEANP